MNKKSRGMSGTENICKTVELVVKQLKLVKNNMVVSGSDNHYTFPLSLSTEQTQLP